MALVEPGRKAPAFSLKDQNGKLQRLSDYVGQPVVLYFYPKDDTPGCTKEACDFRDNFSRLKSIKTAVLGVSILDEASKARFAAKYDLAVSTARRFRTTKLPRSTASGRRSPGMAAPTWESYGRRSSSTPQARSSDVGTT